MSARVFRPVALAVPLLALALAGCKKDPEEKKGGELTPIAADAPAQGGPAATPLRPEALAPIIREVGPEGGLPQRVVFEFSRPIARDDQRGTTLSAPATRLEIEPAVEGALSFAGPSTLTFAPAQGFAFGTEYVLRLASVETLEGAIEAPAAGAWSHTFRTPEFGFVRHALTSIHPRGGHATVALTFSGPVDVQAVRRVSEFFAGGEPVTNTKFSTASGDPSTVLVQLVGSKVRPGAQVRYVLAGGLRSTGGGNEAPGTEAAFEIPAGKRILITRAALQEGSNGFYVDVGCREVDANTVVNQTGGDWNSGDEEYEDYYYGRREDRCTLDEEEALGSIRFNPPVRVSVAPSRMGFRIFGDFKRGPHTLTIDAGTVSKSGAVTYTRYEKALSVPARRPQLSFAASGRYLPRSAWRNLGLNHMNVEKAELQIRHVPSENLVFWLSDPYAERADERTSNLIAKKELALSAPADTSITTHVDLASLVPNATKGVLEVSVFNAGARATSRLLLTDMSLVAKRTPPSEGVPESVRVWALGIETNDLLSGVEVSLVKKSGQTVTSCTTSGGDGCTLNVPGGTVDPSAPFALIARKGDDLTYLRYQDLKTEIAESDVQGEPYRAAVPYRASIYTDRGVYRPGEVAHVVAIVRADDELAPPPGLPVQLEVIDPRQRTFKKQILKTNEAGMIPLDVRFEAYQDTGVYQVRLSIAERLVATQGINVEEFVPERMKVSASTVKPGYLLGESIPVDVEAVYLFGGSASDSPVEASCRLEAALFKPKEHGNFSYGVYRQSEAKPVTLGQVKQTLDEKGRARLECPAPSSAGGFKGPAKLVSQVAVFEAGSGRSTQNAAQVAVHPERFYLGLQSGAQKVKAGTPFTVSGVVVDWDGKLVLGADAPKTVEVELLRLEREYGYFWDEAEGTERYQHHMRAVRESNGTAQVSGGKFQLELNPGQDGEAFLVRVKGGRAQTDLQLAGQWSWWWWGGEHQADQTPRPMRATSLPIEPPGLAKVGEPVKVKIKAPYKGRVLFTAETDRVIAAEWRAVDAGEQTWTFTPKAFAPNVYVSAFLVKDPHLESAESFMPDRAFGVTSVKIEPTAYTQQLKLEVPSEVRSNSELTVTIDAGELEGDTWATVAAVDEGILSLTRFKSPDPHVQLFTQRALGVETYETIGWTLLVPPQGNSRSTGGDGEGDAGDPSGRVQPVKPVALWSGLVKLDSRGKATVKFDVPQYRGSLRVMAVTAGPKRIGRASANVTVRDPITLQTTLPRFLSYGDRIEIPVFVTNVSGKPLDVNVKLVSENLPVPGMSASAVTESPLELLGKPEGNVRIEDGKSATLVFQARAAKSVGAAKLTVIAKGGGFESRDSLDVPFNPAGPRERVVQKLELAEGTIDLKPYFEGWEPTTERSTIWVTTNPYGESFDHLKYLVQYPHGCIEQTTSTTRPMLFVSNILDSVDPTLLGGGEIEQKVMAGVGRVLAMQTPSGGFSYWPGAQEPVAWGTAYATHMLIDAQKAGFNVPQDRLDAALKWMNQELDRWDSGTANRSGHYQDHEGDAEPYMHYVAALTGKGRKGSILKLLETMPKPARGKRAEHAFMLKAALYLAGDRRYERDLKNPDVSPIEQRRENRWDFYSDRRRRGLMLSTIEDLFPAAPSSEQLANLVASSLHGKSSGWFTTQELMWGITGLGKRVGATKGEFAPPVLTAGAKKIEARPNPRLKSSDRTWALARAGEYPTLTLDLPKKGDGKVFAILSSEGVKTNAEWEFGGNGLAVKRTYRDLEGNEIDLTAGPVDLAKLVFVEIEVRNDHTERVQNLVLTDRLPAGFEIENPRLNRGGPVSWIDANETWAPDYLSVRDDRLEVFGALERGQTKKVVYAVRAVTSGKFTLPPIEIQAMYDPTLWARQPGGEVEVASPWKDFLL